MWTKTCTFVRKWLYSYPDYDDSFGVHIRETWQSIFPCNHVWILNKEKYRRKCACCWKYQHLVYHRYGSIRTEWVDLPHGLFNEDEYDNK